MCFLAWCNEQFVQLRYWRSPYHYDIGGWVLVVCRHPGLDEDGCVVQAPHAGEDLDQVPGPPAPLGRHHRPPAQIIQDPPQWPVAHPLDLICRENSIRAVSREVQCFPGSKFNEVDVRLKPSFLFCRLGIWPDRNRTINLFTQRNRTGSW